MIASLEYVELGSIVDCLDNERVPVSDEERQKRKGDVPYYGANGQVGFIDDFLFNEELLLLAEDGGSWGPNEKCAYIISGKSWVNNHAHVLRCRENVDIHFLMYFLNYTDLRSYVSGTTRGKLNQQRMNQIEVLFPEIHIQKNIAKIFMRVESTLEKRRQTIRLSDDFLKSAFLEMFGDPLRNNKNLSTYTLDKIVSSSRYSLKRGPFGGSLKKEIFVKSGYKVYEQKHAIRNDFKIGGYYIDEEKFKEMKPFEIKPDDLIISCSGTIGKVAIVPDGIEKGIINQALLKLTLDQGKVIPIYFKYLLETPAMQSKLFGFTHGSSMKNVASVATLKTIKYPIGSKQKQQKFADLVQRVKRLKEKQKQSETQLQNLFNSLMQRAFKGELFKTQEE